MTDAAQDNTTGRRRLMVENQLRRRDITDPRVLAAFEAVPRERFVCPEDASHAYDDTPLPIGWDQTISQPYIVALMCQELRVQAHHRVLDVGVGSGYQAAILAHLADEVYGIERIEPLAERARAALASLDLGNVSVAVGDGTLGWAEHAPYDRIVCGASAPDLPAAWVDQLASDGRVILPIGKGDIQQLKVVEKRHGELVARSFCDVRFVRLIGEQGW